MYNVAVKRLDGTEKQYIDSFDNSLTYLIHRTGQLTDAIFSTHVQDLTPRQFVILTYLSTNKNLSQSDLVDKTGIDRSTVSDIVRRLETRGFVTRTKANNDARAYMISITRIGAQRLRNAQKGWSKAEQSIRSVIPSQHWIGFHSALSSLSQHMDILDQKKEK